MTDWIGAAHSIDPPWRDPALALHLIWLVAAGLIARDDSGLRLLPTATAILREPPERLYDLLLDETCFASWEAAAAGLGLSGVVPDLLRHFACQSLQRRPPVEGSIHPLATWDDTGEWEWRLCLRPNGDPGLLFRLLALGRYEPSGRLLLTPISLAAPTARGLGYDHVRLLLETATGHPLDASHQGRLREWLGRAGVYRLRGPLLQTSRPEHLAALYAVRRLRPYLVEQISPRCALFDPAGLPALRRRLDSINYPLDVIHAGGDDHPDAAPPVPPGDVAAFWCGLRLLEGLQRYIPLPGPLPQTALERLAASLPAAELAILDAGADRLLDDLHAVIQGRDAFLPAPRPPAEELLACLRAAIDAEETVTLDYQPVGSPESRRHTVEPLRLDQRENLTYLIAYSYRAEATLTFRLDRVIAWQ